MDINNVNSNGQAAVVRPIAGGAQKVPEVKREQIEIKHEFPGSNKDLEGAVKFVNKVLFKNNTHLKFQVHEVTNDIMVKIVDDATGDIVKEIPPEKLLDMVAKLWEIAGIIVDERR
ncbi:flagellar protein FlaG [Oxobacter pfennigii]|uniref:Flagellar protein FlaG n=1 Tax=Oxobacter pfennigii TaxID=36849 RepID=A0A0P8X1I1_9CLOT|nr:flagellar protein FlaG [Oxobacter pfennigii]KPU44676.1 flagellar protein FlaG [Oxobacter pfennigii]